MKALRKLTTKLTSETPSPTSAIVVDGEIFDDAHEVGTLLSIAVSSNTDMREPQTH